MDNYNSDLKQDEFHDDDIDLWAGEEKVLVFQDLEVDKNEVSDMLIAEGGRNFFYDGSELEWLD